MLIGIVGKPNTGKSTFFKAATLSEVEIANYPFVTIKPNEGVGFIKTECPETFFNVKCEPQHGYCLDSNRFVPIKLLDVAGLVPDAHKGKGIGNQFLNDLSGADVLIHIIDASGSTNESGEPVAEGSYDPVADVRFLEDEIDMWLFGLILKNWDKFTTKTSLENLPVSEAISEYFSGLKVSQQIVKTVIKKLNLSSNLNKWNKEQIKAFATELRIFSKPIIIAANKSDTPVSERNIKRLKNKFKNYKVIPCSSESELALKEAAKHGLIKYIPGDKDFKEIKKDKLSDRQNKALKFISDNVLCKFGSTGVQNCLNTAVSDILKYSIVYPVPKANLKDARGNVLPDAFLLPPESTALDLAYSVHTDIGKGFIRAVDIRTKRTIGKEHKLKDGDVVEIISNN